MQANIVTGPVHTCSDINGSLRWMMYGAMSIVALGKDSLLGSSLLLVVFMMQLVHRMITSCHDPSQRYGLRAPYISLQV